ncbi:hypothetical protein IVB27_34045 [Bradyrhizobium sp. 197]|uniref:hypothetical protein n=1 Tax=Bradyrhizobium sp. 197 TaxID=2782663 RepID=UPI001FF84FD6|nr:hypothetical protein [Bradyrhizobium sp. 197]MCK1479634.1 hypothetical protein [Bradyrhizobium sp. 197]
MATLYHVRGVDNRGCRVYRTIMFYLLFPRLVLIIMYVSGAPEGRQSRGGRLVQDLADVAITGDAAKVHG